MRNFHVYRILLLHHVTRVSRDTKQELESIHISTYKRKKRKKNEENKMKEKDTLTIGFWSIFEHDNPFFPFLLYKYVHWRLSFIEHIVEIRVTSIRWKLSPANSLLRQTHRVVFCHSTLWDSESWLRIYSGIKKKMKMSCPQKKSLDHQLCLTNWQYVAKMNVIF